MSDEAKRCYACRKVGIDRVHVKERRPGSRGWMPSSFWAEYALCPRCLEACKEARAVLGRHEWKHVGAVIVAAKTLEWLRLHIAKIQEQEEKGKP